MLASECRAASTWLQGAMSQKTLNFKLAAVRTWNLTQRYSCLTSSQNSHVGVAVNIQWRCTETERNPMAGDRVSQRIVQLMSRLLMFVFELWNRRTDKHMQVRNRPYKKETVKALKRTYLCQFTTRDLSLSRQKWRSLFSWLRNCVRLVVWVDTKVWEIHAPIVRHEDRNSYSRRTMRWSLRGVNILSAVRGEYWACRWTEDFLLVSAKVT
jgi:hypothetical protein